MKVDIKIVNGRIIDPTGAGSATDEILVKENRIVTRSSEKIEADTIIDATGCIITPGLIDFHAHVFSGGTDAGIPADLSLLPMGVTTVVDGGSCGVANYESFVQAVVKNSRMRVYSMLNVSSGGIITKMFSENVNPECYDIKRIKQMFIKYKENLVGLKLRISKNVVGELGIKPLTETIRLGEELNCSVVVHVTNPPVEMKELIKYFRAGDVFCHVHHGTGETILSADGKVQPALIAAQQRGVIFDAANGRNNFSLKVAEQAIAENFLPDIISSDLTAGTLFDNILFGLPHVMTKYLNMGMPLEKIINAVTSMPAKHMGKGEQLGTLQAGALADIAIFKIVEKDFEIKDKFGDVEKCKKCFVPQMTILDGKIVFRQFNFGITIPSILQVYQ